MQSIHPEVTERSVIAILAFGLGEERAGGGRSALPVIA